MGKRFKLKGNGKSEHRYQLKQFYSINGKMLKRKFHRILIQETWRKFVYYTEKTYKIFPELKENVVPFPIFNIFSHFYTEFFPFI